MITIKKGDHIVVILNSGKTIVTENVSNETYKEILQTEDDDKVIDLLFPKLGEKRKEVEEEKYLLLEVENSAHLIKKGESVYMEGISEISMPKYLIEAFLTAEEENNQVLIDTYKNFWLLCSLNPDSRARTNLFWFLEKYGFQITPEGLFVAYRQVERRESKKDKAERETIEAFYNTVKQIKKKNPRNYNVLYDLIQGDYTYQKDTKDINIEKYMLVGNLYNLFNRKQKEVFTDNYSKSFKIEIGKLVSMPREAVDEVQENTCSRGLHVASKEWLLDNHSFGNVDLKVLVNPRHVVAVPPEDSYGKMRVCEYLPIEVVEDLKEDNFNAPVTAKQFTKVAYDGKHNDDDKTPFLIGVDVIPEIDGSNVYTRLEEIRERLKGKVHEQTISGQD